MLYHKHPDADTPLYWVLGEVAALWAIVNAGYYMLQPLFGLELSYNSSPFVIAGYYAVWVAISLAYFWDLFKKKVTVKYHIWLYGLLSLSSAGAIVGLLYIFSQLPILQGISSAPYTDILFATPWYFLPKSIEILIQQILIAVMVLELSFHFPTLREIKIAYAVCFGGAHVLLFSITGAPTPHAAMMITGSVLSALIFPPLILRVRGGFVYAYMIHLLFYILLAIILRTLPPLLN